MIDVKDVVIVDHTFLSRVQGLSNEWPNAELGILGIDELSPHSHRPPLEPLIDAIPELAAIASKEAEQGPDAKASDSSGTEANGNSGLTPEIGMLSSSGHSVGLLAQLVEQRTFNPTVQGSNP